MKLRIGLSKPKNNKFPIFSWGIRAIERTEYSHVYLQWDSKYAGTCLTYHAAGHSLKFIGQDIFNKTVNPLYVYEIEITRDQYKNLLNYCFTKAGTDYGTLQILGMLWSRVCGLFSGDCGNPLADGEKTQVCSELVARVLDDIVDLAVDFDNVTPRDIKEILDKLLKEGKVVKIL